MITEIKNDKFQADLPEMLCDDIISSKIDGSLCNKNFVSLVVGAAGTGKTSIVTALVTSKKKGCKAYRQQFEDVILNIPRSSLRSIKGDPYKTIEDENVRDDLDAEFLDFVLEKAEENSSQKYRTLVIIDDASSKLKQNKEIIDKLTGLVHKHRHLALSMFILVQDLVSVPLGIRKNVSQLFYFKPSNEKSNQIFREEFMGLFTKDETNSLLKFVFRKKGDFLNIKIQAEPIEYYRNFNKLIIGNTDNAPQKEKEKNKCGPKDRAP